MSGPGERMSATAATRYTASVVASNTRRGCAGAGKSLLAWGARGGEKTVVPDDYGRNARTELASPT